jgi:hypothetical protein
LIQTAKVYDKEKSLRISKNLDFKIFSSFLNDVLFLKFLIEFREN